MALEVYDNQQDGWVAVSSATRIPTTPRVMFRSTGLDGSTADQTIGEITLPGRPVRVFAWGANLGGTPNITGGTIALGIADPTETEDTASVLLKAGAGAPHYNTGDLDSTAPRAMHCTAVPERFNIELVSVAESGPSAAFDIYIEAHQEF